MSPKLMVGLSFGTGGVVMGSYAAINHVYGEEIIIVDIKQIPEETGANMCTTPIKKATITTDESVVYYICNEISNSTPNGTTLSDPTTSFTSVEKSSFTQKTTSPTPTTPSKGTYKRDDNSSEIDIYGYTDLTDKVKNIFLIKTPDADNSKINLQTDSDIRRTVKAIEELRIDQTLTISATSTNDKVIDSITCTKPKKATNKHTNIEYYVCSTITEGTTTTSSDTPTAKTSTTFTYDTTFKNKSGDKHNITKGTDKATTPTSTFYGFNPKDTPPKEKEVFFLTGKENTHMSDADAKDLILKIKQLRNG